MKRVTAFGRAGALAIGMIGAGGAWAQGLDGSQPFAVTGIGQMTAQVESGGISYVCGLTQGEGVLELAGCLPVVTAEQADRMAELAARVADLTAAVAEAEGRAAAATARADSAEAAAAEATARADGAEATAAAATARADSAEAARAEAQAAAEAARDALTVAEVEIQALRDRLAPFVAAEAQLAVDQAMFDRVVALEQSAVKIGLLTGEEAAALLLDAMDATMEEMGDRCTLTLARLEEMGGERWLNMQVYTKALDALEVPQDSRDVILGEAIGNRADPDNPYRAFDRALDDTSDFQIRARAGDALRMAGTNFGELDRLAESLFTDPAVFALAADRSQVTRVGCE